MPFPLISSEVETDEILNDPYHIAYANLSWQAVARNIYRQKFLEAEQKSCKRGRPSQKSIAQLLDGAASRIYSCIEKLGIFGDMDQDLTMKWFGLPMDSILNRQYIILGKMRSRMEGMEWALIISASRGQMSVEKTDGGRRVFNTVNKMVPTS